MATADEGALTDEQFQRLAQYGIEEWVEVGRHLYSSGDKSYDQFLLRTAAVEVIREGTTVEPEHLVYRRGPGDFLGELSLLTGQAVYLTARVTEPGRVIRIDTATFRRLLGEGDGRHEQHA